MFQLRFKLLSRPRRGARLRLFAAGGGLLAGTALASQRADAPTRCHGIPRGEFQGRTLVITGAGGSFGRAGVLHFARLGANVVATDVVPSSLHETQQLAEADTAVTGSVVSVLCDVTNPDDIDRMVETAENTFGRIDLLWNNAGYMGDIKPCLEYPLADFARVYAINVVGAFSVAQKVAASMVRSGGGGVIVNTASVAGLRGTPAMPAYASSKAAIITLTVALAKDLAPYGIRVNAISPALIGPSAMWETQNELHATCNSPYYARDPESVARAKIAGVPMKRVGTTAEVVQGVEFLLSAQSSYCAGTNLIVDGGMAAGIH